jgi:hypothetical protein
MEYVRRYVLKKHIKNNINMSLLGYRFLYGNNNIKGFKYTMDYADDDIRIYSDTNIAQIDLNYFCESLALVKIKQPKKTPFTQT